nr:hypothetical protein [Tanacetum cinerariifolium]
YAFLIWEDFVYQVEHKNQKKSNEMYYPRFTKVIIHHFMMKKPSIPRRNKVNWHYVRDDILFSTIKVVLRHQNTQQYGAILPIELTTEDIRNTKAYKEYYACATGEAAPKPKASARRKKGGSVSSTTPPTPIATPIPITTVVAAPRLTAAAKGKQPARATSPADPSDVERTEAEQLKIVLRRSRTPEESKDDGNGEEDQGLRIKVYKATTDQLDWDNPEGLQYPHNLLQPLPLIPDNRGRRVIPFAHFINNDLEYLRGGASSRKYITSMTKTKAADYGHIKWIKDLFYGFDVNRESALDVYSKRRIIAVTDLKIVEWHNYKHLDWISVRRDDDKIYKFKEGDFKRLRLQDIEDMLLLLIQGKLSNLTRRVEDLQLGVESYQKRLNLTKPDTYRSDLKRCEAYTAYSNPRGFIYQNKKNRLMRIDELHKFSDETLNDVRNALDDHLKGIRMQYLPTTIWRKGDKDRAVAMIQAIDKMLKTRRIMRSLEMFVGGRQYERDFRMLQRTI